MDYEKKYKEAVNKIKNLLDDGEKNGFTIVTYKTDLESIFPELKESEDEKIRKTLIDYFNTCAGDYYGELKLSSILAWLEKQGEQKQEINNFDVLPGLYKCVHRMFDGTPDGRLLFEVGNVYKCLSKHDRAEFEVSYGHSVYLEDPVVCKHFIPFEKQDEVESDNDDIEVEEKGIRKAFNKIWDEKQGEQKPAVEMKTPEESLGIDSDTYNEIVDECIYSEQKSQRMISAEAKEAMYDKPAWSEEDDAMLDTIEGWLDTLCEYLKDSRCEYIPNVKYCIDRLKSLKTRYTWKPSDEQIEILDMVLTNESMDDNIARILRELREQLKKLKGE